MKRFFGLASFAAIGVAVAPASHAQDFCKDMTTVLRAAATEFEALRGQALRASDESIAVFSGLQGIARAKACAVAQQGHAGGATPSTSYTCSPVAPDTDAGMRSLMTSIADCLQVTVWTEQDGAMAGRISAYGMLRLSVTRNGELGLALGVEAFRDSRGEVIGSPTRGDQIESDGRHRCTAKSHEEITRLFEMYGAQPGATRFENRQFVGYTNKVSAPTVAFVTKPIHPAHPAIIVRNVTENENGAQITAQGDFAGDCVAFHTLLEEVATMNAGLRQQ